MQTDEEKLLRLVSRQPGAIRTYGDVVIIDGRADFSRVCNPGEAACRLQPSA